jgi:hypothetical protein
MGKRRRFSIALGSALAVACLAPAAASALIAPMGSALQKPYAGGVCNANCMSTQQTQVGGASPHPIEAPGNGNIVSWAVRTGDPGAIYQLVVLRPTGFASGGFTGYTSVTRTPASAPMPAGVTDNIIIFGLVTPVPIRAGDHIGVFQTGAADGGLVQAMSNGVPTDKITNFFAGNTLLDGSAAVFQDDQQHELLLQATLDYCKVDDVVGQKLKAARTTLVANGCEVEVKKKGKGKKKGAKVSKQDPAAGGGADDGSRTVTLTVGKAKKKTK